MQWPIATSPRFPRDLEPDDTGERWPGCIGMATPSGIPEVAAGQIISLLAHVLRAGGQSAGPAC